MGTATVVTLTPQQARDERAQLLTELGMTFDEARERAEDYQLTATEVVRWSRIEELTWLLGE